MDITQYFAKDWHGAPFVLFGAAHLGGLIALILLNLWVSTFKNASETTKIRIRWIIAIVLWLDESAWHIWKASIGEWTIQEMLPLNLCSMLIWLAGFMLIFKNYSIYEFVYFLGIGGAFQALLTPEVGIYGFPHFRFFQTLISHGMLLTSGVYMTVAEGFRPTWKSILRIAVVINVYLVIIFFINNAIGSNYLFVAHKPETASIIDLLPPWPWYILYMEAIGILTCVLLYIPFMIKDWRTARVATT